MSKRAKIFPLVLITAIVVAMLSVASVASTLGTCSTSLSPERCSCVANSHPCHGEANTRTMVSLTGKLVSYTIPNQTQKLVTGERWKTGDEATAALSATGYYNMYFADAYHTCGTECSSCGANKYRSNIHYNNR